MIDRTPRDRVGPGQIPGAPWGLFKPSPTRHMTPRTPKDRTFRLVSFSWERSTCSSRVIWTLRTKYGVGWKRTTITTCYEHGIEAPARVVAARLRETLALHRGKVAQATELESRLNLSGYVTCEAIIAVDEYDSLADLFGGAADIWGKGTHPDGYTITIGSVERMPGITFHPPKSKAAGTRGKGFSVPSLRQNRWGGFK